MSRCFIRLLIVSCIREPQFIPKLGGFYKNRGFTWRVSDGDELVGLLTGDDGVLLPRVLVFRVVII